MAPLKLSRRSFLQKSGALAGGTMPFMLALGLLKSSPAQAFKLTGDGKGKSIVILGGGLSGMTAAYELNKLGYHCTILEARERSGGRCCSVRNGSSLTEIKNGLQRAEFDDGLYFNAGPSRIPHHHQLTLHYCKELGVPLQIYNNVNENAYYFSEGKGRLSNKKIRIREIHNDLRGYTTELLAKAIDQGKLDTNFSKEDSEKIISWLMAEGGLDPDKLYKASARRGYIEQPGPANRAGKIADPYTLSEIIGSGLMDADFYNVAEYTYELQMTMFQATGGMDGIAKALEKKVLPMLKLGAQVDSITNLEQGVNISYKDKEGSKSVTADICICTIPLPVLSNIDHNFSGEVSRAIDFASYIPTCKMGLQFKRRFWEDDEAIYGGITHTNNELTQIFYPSNDYQSKKGMLLGYYNFNDKAQVVGELSYHERVKMALNKGALIHPQYPAEFEKAFSVSWHKVPQNLGGWAVYTGETRKTLYQALLKPEKQIYFAGEHMTYLNAWMAGAFESARSVVADVHTRLSEQQNQYPATGEKK